MRNLSIWALFLIISVAVSAVLYLAFGLTLWPRIAVSIPIMACIAHIMERMDMRPKLPGPVDRFLE